MTVEWAAPVLGTAGTKVWWQDGPRGAVRPELWAEWDQVLGQGLRLWLACKAYFPRCWACGAVPGPSCPWGPLHQAGHWEAAWVPGHSGRAMAQAWPPGGRGAQDAAGGWSGTLPTSWPSWAPSPPSTMQMPWGPGSAVSVSGLWGFPPWAPPALWPVLGPFLETFASVFVLCVGRGWGTASTLGACFSDWAGGGEPTSSLPRGAVRVPAGAQAVCGAQAWVKALVGKPLWLVFPPGCGPRLCQREPSRTTVSLGQGDR